MKSYLIIVSLIFSSLYLFAQDQKEAEELAMEAIQLMDEEKFDQSIELLEKCIELNPENIAVYRYEIAYANYSNENYKKAIKILEDMIDKDQTFDKVYQMLGNAYDLKGKESKAIETYDKGLTLYPGSGILHLERGYMELEKKNYNEALYYYEEGIKAEPGFSSNYFYATSIFLNSEEEVWGMIYGELFMNIERGSDRTPMISKALYDIYKSQILFENDTSISISFSNNNTIEVDENFDTESFKLPFGIGVYEPLLLMSAIGEDSISIAALNRMRTKFLEEYYEKDHHKEYPNVLFEYQKKIEEAGHLEAYNYWIMLKGNETEFNEWYEKNIRKWDDFLEWFKKNPIEIDSENYFIRYNR